MPEDQATKGEVPLVRRIEMTDIEPIGSIYAHYVLTTGYTFEIEPPTPADLTQRVEAVLACRLPFLVATFRGAVVGYAYASQYRSRAAYAHTLEDSVYLHPDSLRRGIGSSLLRELLIQCADGPWEQMVAVIGDSTNTASVRLHQRFGFRHSGILHAVGRKLGRNFDTVLMQRALKP